MTRALCLLLLLLVPAACGPSEPPPETGDGAVEPLPAALVPTLTVRIEGDSVRFALQVSNATDSAVVLQFGTAQRYDFVVRTEGGEELWRWSEGQMFSQALGEERIEPGRSLEYHEVWAGPVTAGLYRGVGRLVSVNGPVELETPFEVVAR